MEFLSAPLNIDQFFKTGFFPKVDVQQSIIQTIWLIIATHHREFRHMPGFGCEFWDAEFELTPGRTSDVLRIKRSIEKALQRYEPRIIVEKIELKFVSKGVDEKILEIYLEAREKITNTHIYLDEQISIAPFIRFRDQLI
jgi:phage baseplate assembly protein W